MSWAVIGRQSLLAVDTLLALPASAQSAWKPERPARVRLIEIGVEPLSSTSAEFDALMEQDCAYWVPLIRELGITLEG